VGGGEVLFPHQLIFHFMMKVVIVFSIWRARLTLEISLKR
jgi:hypothetical protein